MPSHAYTAGPPGRMHMRMLAWVLPRLLRVCFRLVVRRPLIIRDLRSPICSLLAFLLAAHGRSCGG